ncbi:DUF58 domain-containing protein [Cellulomonas palmilytica]|uniref:DUF58 domain-containing protein n=1 Tax=Cellulomonas palmilytica TaxID=2608402 RepID=UPI001F21169D|nr:DUF58 domain-containing protein [Cellulomonas palmilytica]UJP39518.1 DUF58 domain-containing protein [Cellulomonas palmilytica]
MALTWRAVLLAALGIPVVLLLPATGTVLVWGAFVVLACAVDALLAASPREVAVRREVPASVRLGEPVRSTVTLTHVGRRRRLRAHVRDAWPPSAGASPGGDPGTGGRDAQAHPDRHAVDLAPGDARRVRTVLVPTRRGDLHGDRVTIRAWGPLGLAGRQASVDVPTRLRVLPAFRSRRHLASRLARLRELDGRAAVQIRGAGTEFDSLREYVIGDDVRSIDWRASARRADVVVRTWRPERDRRVMIVLDTGRTSAVRVQDEPRLDAGVEAALLLSALAQHAGDRVELLAYDRRVRARVAGTSGPRLMPALADQLAGVTPTLVETDWPGVVAQVRARMSQRALVVLLTTLEPVVVEHGLLDVVAGLTDRHQVVVASVADPEVAELARGREDATAVFDAAAAERAGLERAAVAVRLRQRGAEVVEGLPDDLAPRLADTYLALKAAGRL